MNKECSRRILTCVVLFPLLMVNHSILSRTFVYEKFPCFFTWGICNAAENVEIFSKDIAKQKENVDKDFERVDEVLAVAKLQEARSGLDVLEYKIGKMKKNLAKQEMESYRQRIDKQRKSVAVKEDSLVSKAFDLMRAKGVDASLQYTQNELRNHGVTEKKINDAEKKILKELYKRFCCFGNFLKVLTTKRENIINPIQTAIT